MSVSGEPSHVAPEGAVRWLSVHDDLLRGLTHSLSNRVGTIAAAAYMVEMQPATLSNTASTLRAESERLEQLLQLFRLLPRRADSVAEPIVPTDAVSQAIALQSHHADLREIPITVTVDGDLQPAYAEPAALALAVVVLLGTAHRAIAGHGNIVVTISSSTDHVRINTCGVPTADAVLTDDEHVERDAAADAAAVQWLLAAVGGDGRRSTNGAELIVPTLQAARRATRR